MSARSTLLLLCALLGPVTPACGKKTAAPVATPGDPVGMSVRPAALAQAIRARGGARANTRARFIVTADPKVVRERSSMVIAPDAGTPHPADVTTTGALTLDRAGHFHLLESNDHDGGREVYWYAGGLAVALRHGKLIRQPPDDRAAERVLGEALGAPLAAWELAGRQARLTVAGEEGAGETRYTVALADAPPAPVSSAPAADPVNVPAAALQAWRDSVRVEELSGTLRLAANQAPGSPALLVAFQLRGRFSARQGDQPVAGYFDVSFELEQLGAVSNIEAPPAEELVLPQRTILDERALLGGVPSRIPAAAPKAPPAPPPPAAAPSGQKR